REFRPHVVTTYDENGGYPHPDHIMCHKISVAALDPARDPDRYPQAREPLQPLKPYYPNSFSPAREPALHQPGLAAGKESPDTAWLARRDDRPDTSERITTRVECAEYFPVRDDALRAHATQVDPDGMWFAVPLEIQQKVWPTEDYQLARSLVGETEQPED